MPHSMSSDDSHTHVDAMSGTHPTDIEKGDLPDLPKTAPQTPRKAGPLMFAADDPDDPRKWPVRKRLRHVVIVCLMTLALTYISSAYALSVQSIELAFHISREAAMLGVSLYVLGFAVGPLLFAPASEIEGIGRNPVYWVTYVCFTAFCIGAGFAPNIGAMLVCRFFAGLFGSSSINNAAATIADVTTIAERGPWTLIYAICAFGGPALSPIVAGFIESFAPTWRWNLHVCSILAGTTTVLALVGLEETHHPTIIYRRAAGRDGKTVERRTRAEILGMFKVAIARPAQILFTEPIAILVSIYLAVLYGVLYGFFAGFAVVFEGIRGFTPWQYGLTYISTGVGFLLSIAAVGIGHKKIYVRKMQESPDGKVRPELVFVQTFWAGPLAAISLFIFAWTAPFTNIHWIAPCIGMFLFGVSMLVIYTGFIPYLVNCYQAYAASALAVGTFTRAGFGCSFPLFMVQMFNRLTVQGAISLLAGILLLLAPIPWIFWRIGPALRKRSKLATE